MTDTTLNTATTQIAHGWFPNPSANLPGIRDLFADAMTKEDPFHVSILRYLLEYTFYSGSAYGWVEDSRSSIDQICKGTGISARAVKKKMSELASFGCIIRVRQGNHGDATKGNPQRICMKPLIDDLISGEIAGARDAPSTSDAPSDT